MILLLVIIINELDIIILNLGFKIGSFFFFLFFFGCLLLAD